MGISGGVALASVLDACGNGPGAIAPTPPPGATVIRARLFDQVGYDPSVLQTLANKFRALPRAVREHPRRRALEARSLRRRGA